MTRQLLFKTFIVDSVLVTEATTYSFFAEASEGAESVTTLSESASIRWLLSNPHFRNDYVSEFLPQPHQVRTFTEQVEPFTRSHTRPGDIDLILVHPALPTHAVAFEWKRVKAISRENDIVKLNRA